MLEERLPLLADANFHLGVAEEAISEQRFESARNELDKGEAALQELRDAYAGLNEEEQPLMAKMAGPLSVKARQLKAALPKRQLISDGTAEVDPEQERDPEEGG